MPEGPEIRREAETIAAAIAGRCIERVEFAHPHLKKWQRTLTGQQLMATTSRGKAMLNQFANGFTLYSHNQLYGQWVVHRVGDRLLPNLQVRAALHSHDAVAVLYSASDIAVWRTDDLQRHPYLMKLGTELLDPATTQADVLMQINQPRFARRPLGALLLDQGFLAGVGNYLRSDILHAARLPANIRIADLKPKQREALAHWALALTRQSLKTAGVTNDLLLAARLQNTGVDFEARRFRVFAREGLPCHDCSGTIRRLEVTGRGWFYCPSCLGAADPENRD